MTSPSPPRRSATVPGLGAGAALVTPSFDHVGSVAAQAASDAGVDPGMLGGYLSAVLEAARAGRRLARQELDACRRSGEEAADRGVVLAAVLDLYLSATWRLWGDIATRAAGADPAAVAAVAAILFRAADDGAAALAGGYEEAQRRTVRFEELLRREFVDDLLSGTADPELLQERAARFGFNLAGSHEVTVARADRRLVDAGPVYRRIEARVLAAFGGRDAVVATKEGLLVCVFPDTGRGTTAELVRTLEETGEGPWRVGVGEAHPGPGGVVRSYGEARQSLELGARCAGTGPVVRFGDLLPWRLLVADPSLGAELIDAVLGPLDAARGGAQHLIDTLDAFVATGGNVSAAARSLHLSSRAVVYRLERIAQLTGYSPQDPEGRFVLELAVRARRLVAASPAAAELGVLAPPAPA